jgi:hypothetical protein
MSAALAISGALVLILIMPSATRSAATFGCRRSRSIKFWRRFRYRQPHIEQGCIQTFASEGGRKVGIGSRAVKLTMSICPPDYLT